MWSRKVFIELTNERERRHIFCQSVEEMGGLLGQMHRHRKRLLRKMK